MCIREFTAAATRQFLKDWGVHHCISSVAYPHSNCRAEVAVKTVKRLITNNTSPNCDLHTTALQRAVLQYRNTTNADTKLSPAQCIFGRPIKDFIPILPGRYRPHPAWRKTLSAREEALTNRHMRTAEMLTKHTKRLPPLKAGDHVRIQNQTGSHPTKWDKTGQVVEVKKFDQYVICVGGSGRVTLRNRKFLQKCDRIQQRHPPQTIPDNLINLVQPPIIPSSPTPTCNPPQPTSPDPPIRRTPFSENPSPNHDPSQNPNGAANPPSATETPPPTATKPPKPPLALRRLQDHNKKGLLE